MDETYPESVIEVLDDSLQFPAEIITTVQRFAQAGPWRGSRLQRQKRFRALVAELAQESGIVPPALSFRNLDGGHSGTSHYNRGLHRIVLSGKLSVVTCLHEFAHCLGMGERDACRWSVNLFRRCFPRQYGRLIHVGHVLLRPADLARRSGCGKARRGILTGATANESLSRSVQANRRVPTALGGQSPHE